MLSVVFLLPLIADGFLQSLTKYESSNIKRLVTGILFGYGISVLFISSTEWVMRNGYSLGKMLKAK